MTKWDKFRVTLLSGRSDSNIDFEDLLTFLKRLNFAERTAGSHHILSHDDVVEILTLQPLTGGKAKPYQVKQVRALIEQYGL
jgi:predicted RNA binding protein YcfA (HicA-like mRNA interferase family)